MAPQVGIVQGIVADVFQTLRKNGKERGNSFGREIGWYSQSS
jgi:hypothetical protein